MISFTWLFSAQCGSIPVAFQMTVGWHWCDHSTGSGSHISTWMKWFYAVHFLLFFFLHQYFLQGTGGSSGLFVLWWDYGSSADHGDPFTDLQLRVSAVIAIITCFSLTSNHQGNKTQILCCSHQLSKLKGLFSCVESDLCPVSHWDQNTTGSSSFWTIYPMNSEGMIGLST